MLKKRLLSFKYAIAGIYELFRSQTNARIHLIMSALVIGMAFFLEVSAVEWCLLIICITIVLATEAVNTALENLTDLLSPDHHPLAGKAKDVAAGAVLITAIGTAIVGLIILLPKLLLIIF